MNLKDNLQKYAELVVEVGVNVQKDQIVVIRTPIDGAEFARAMAESAYKVGAKKVIVDYSDEQMTKLTYTHVSEETLAEVPAYEVARYEELVAKNAAFISISAGDPDLLKDIDPNKISISQKASGTALKVFRKAISNGDVCWCVVSIPTPSWSKKVFPNETSEKAEEMLWDKIFEAVRIYEKDPVEAWRNHTKNLSDKCAYLNNKKIKYLHYTGPGTDLKVELVKGHKWEGGGETGTNGIYFVANMPTEEVFTMPSKYGVNGTLRATKPLVYGGNLIDEFNFTFKDGKIIDFDAKMGKAVLEKLIQTDEGACYLGEVAIVPMSSPVCETNTLFYNTLFDENASCHFAVGNSYPTNIEDGTSMSEEELKNHGANISITHEDFMVGSDKLNIVATTESGETFEVLKNGEWAF